MKVGVRLFSYFQKDRFIENRIRLPESSRIIDLLIMLDINRDDVGILVVNNKDASFDYLFKEGDVLTLIPIIGGG